MKSKTLITLCCTAFLSGVLFSQARAYDFGTGINTNFGTGVRSTFGSGLNSNTGSTLGSGLNVNNGSTFGSGLNSNFGTTYGQGLTKTAPSNQTQSSAVTLPNNGTSSTTTQTNPTQQVQVRNHYFFVPWGFGGSNYSEATPAKTSETSSSGSSNSNSTSVEASSANLYKISVDLGQFNNKAENVKLSVNNHTIKVYGGKYSQTFQIEKKIVKNGIRKEVSGNTLIIYVPLKD